MRRPRLKPLDMPIFYHLYNRVAGEPGFLPFGPAEKEKFIQLMHKIDKLYTVKVVCYQVMSNHFHLVVHAPDQPPTPEEVCRRYGAYYGGKRTLNVSDPFCAVLAGRMRDISWYMHDLQQQFSTWYNRTRPTRRRGYLWAQRFKHTLLGDARAVWACCNYVEMNAVRAALVSDPADYRFSSYGAWCGRGRHPFENHVEEVLLPWLEGFMGSVSAKQLQELMRQAFAGLRGVSENPDGKVSAFSLKVDRRVRYWVDGLVIGSELFIQQMIGRHGGILRPRGLKGMGRAHAPDAALVPLCCYKQLRSL
jgi:REP element-mobilizing transposase RayT